FRMNQLWKNGFVDKAIEVCEAGMLKTPAEERRFKFKNSLAYYLAERANPDDAGRCRGLAHEACNEVPPRPRAVNTKGFVEITFAENEEDLKRGVELCAQALGLGNPVPAFLRAMERAESRRVELGLASDAFPELHKRSTMVF